MDWNLTVVMLVPFFSFLYNVFKISVNTKINISINFNILKRTKKKATQRNK